MDQQLIDRNNSYLVIVDLQEKLAPAIQDVEAVTRNSVALVQAATQLRVPVIATEHCSDRIGHTVPQVLDAATSCKILTKKHFNALAETENRKAFAEHSTQRPIVIGMETHVCVLQTVFGLLSQGCRPIVVADACGSRNVLDRKHALARLADAGATIVTTEMVIFEWLRSADSQDFRVLLPVIKSLKSSS